MPSPFSVVNILLLISTIFNKKIFNKLVTLFVYSFHLIFQLMVYNVIIFICIIPLAWIKILVLFVKKAMKINFNLIINILLWIFFGIYYLFYISIKDILIIIANWNKEAYIKNFHIITELGFYFYFYFLNNVWNIV